VNKFDYINKVMVSDLRPEDKCLLVELIVRADEDWTCFPSVERLCKVRGMKHYKNFKGADYYLPGLVTKSKRGRKNIYTINTPALEGLLEAEVTSRYGNTPAVEGLIGPAVEGVSEPNSPAVADNSPAVEGPNTTTNTTEEDTTENTTESPVADAPVDSIPNFKVKEVEEEVEVLWDIEEASLTFREVTASDTLNLLLEEDAGQSVPETDETRSVDWLFLDSDEKRFFESQEATLEELNEAVGHYRHGGTLGFSWRERAESALERAGIKLVASW